MNHLKYRDSMIFLLFKRAVLMLFSASPPAWASEMQREVPFTSISQTRREDGKSGSSEQLRLENTWLRALLRRQLPAHGCTQASTESVIHSK